MRSENLRRYIRNTEKTVVPSTVAMRVQGMGILRKLPRWLQNRIVEHGSRTDPYMSFIVEPYAVFLAFEITDPDAAARLLPPGYRLHPSAMFADTPGRPCAIVSAFNVHTNVFWGSRVEFYLMAENAETGLLSWIIEEYESNAPSYDPSRGFTLPSTSHSVVSTSYRGEVIVDMSSEQSGNGLALVADMTHGVRTPLDQRVWVEGNLSVDYGSDLQESTKPFGLIFDPGEMAEALKIPLGDISLCTNTFGRGVLDPKPFEVAVFPYAQHFVTTTYPTATAMRTAEDLERAVDEMNDTLGAPEEGVCEA
ncbi:MAG TPA: hypothetical protein VLQ52_05490 [Coriobacteriia bacterium]|nr:hypothetical protein [Coriobacteriia bacterium]